MNVALSNAAREVLGIAGLELVRLYTGSALELNAFDIAARGYDERTDDFFLSTTRNIPTALRLPLEIDHGKRREELVEHYRTEAVRRSCEDYLVRSISVTDACFEEVYELALVCFSADFTEQQQQREVRSSWAIDVEGRTNIAAYLVDTALLRAPPNKQSTIDMVFDRYCEIREVRHALVHNGGRLSEKNQTRLNQLRDRLPENLRHGSIASAGFLEGQCVTMNLNEMLALWQWFYTAIIGFLRESFTYSCEFTAGEA
jgi:hypothetical protein